MARRLSPALLLSLTCAVAPAAAAALEQQPQPFPRPSERPARPREAAPSPPRDEPAPQPERNPRVPEDLPLTGRDIAGPDEQQRAGVKLDRAQEADALPGLEAMAEPVPTEAVLGFPVFSGAQFLKSYNAGQGQRFYLFGTTASYAEVVDYYRDALDEGGNRVFGAPPVHIFEEGRFDEDRMAFPPSVTVKDYAWAGSEGYLDPRPGANPQRYPTVIQIVPPPRRP